MIRGQPAIPSATRQGLFRRPLQLRKTNREARLGMGLAFVAAVNAVQNARMSFKSDGTGLRVEWRIPREAEPITS